MATDEGPTLRRRRLGAELKHCREAAGLTQEQASRAFEWHTAKVTRIEAGRVAVTARDVKDLLNLYNVHDHDYCELVIQLARSAREQAWWAEYRDILSPGSILTLEPDAAIMRNWEPAVVPGLLQTEAYIRHTYAVVPATDLPASVDRLVSLRLARQRRLTDDQPLTLFAVIDESVIHRRIGDANVMADQLRHLIVMSTLPNVDLRIRPYDAGEHPFLGTTVVILEFRDAPDLDVVYAEHRLVKRPADVVRRRDQFERLTANCLDQRRTIDVIETVLADRA